MSDTARRLRILASGDVARVCFVLMLLNTADGMVSTLASPYLGALGYPLTAIGLLVSLYPIASFLSRLPAARLADGRHAHQWLIGSCVVFAASLALYPVAVAPWALWSVRLLHGLSFGTATTLNFASFLAASTPANRARATALFTASWSGGYSIGNFASGLLADQFGFGLAFVVAAVCPIGAIFASPAVATRTVALAKPGTGASSWRVLLHPDVRAVPLLAFTVNFMSQLLATLFPLYVLTIGQSLAVAGSARALQSLTNTLVRPVSGGIVHRFGPLTLGSAGVGVTAVAAACIPLTAAPLIWLGLFVIVGAGRAVGVVANASGTVELTARRVLKRGTASALMSAGGDLGSVVAPLLAGATAASIGIGPSLQVLAIGSAVVGILAVLGGGVRRTAPEGTPPARYA